VSVIEREKVCPLRLISAKDPNKAGCFGMLCMWYQPEAE
jgi:hypothetical protein